MTGDPMRVVQFRQTGVPAEVLETSQAAVPSPGLGEVRVRMLAFGTLSGQPLSFSPRTLMTVGSQVEGFWLGHFMEQQGLVFRLRLVRRLIRLIRAGVLSSEIAGSWPLDQVHEAVAAAEDSGTAGKCLLRLDTT